MQEMVANVLAITSFEPVGVTWLMVVAIDWIESRMVEDTHF